MTQQQMVAMIRTLLFFMGKQMYTPTASAVTPVLLEALSAQALVLNTNSWDVKSNKGTSPAPVSTSGWDVKSSKAR